MFVKEFIFKQIVPPPCRNIIHGEYVLYREIAALLLSLPSRPYRRSPHSPHHVTVTWRGEGEGIRIHLTDFMIGSKSYQDFLFNLFCSRHAVGRRY